MKKNKEFLKGFAAGFATSETVRLAIKLIKNSIAKAVTEIDDEDDETISNDSDYDETAAVDPATEISGDKTIDPE